MMQNLKLLRCLLLLAGVFLAGKIDAQMRKVSGSVTDPSGSSVANASVQIKGKAAGTSADENGRFSLSVKTGDILLVSAVNYTSREIKVDERTSYNIVLALADTSLNEIVVTALGIKRDRRLLNYSTQTVNGDDLLAAKQDNIVNALQGKVSGVQITNSTGQPGSSAQIVIRGNISLTGDNQPLFVIDGVPMDNSEAGNPMGSLGAGSTSNRGIDIDPNIVENITVLKGTTATALYGSAGAKGVVLITTKNGKGLQSGKPLVSFSSSYSLAKAITPDLQNVYAQGSNGVYVDGNNGGIASGSWGPRIDTLKVNGVPVQKHDQLKEFLRTGHTTDNNISVSGTGEKSHYLVSYSYLKTTGIEPTTSYTRNAFFAKYDTKLADKLNLTTQFNYVHSDNPRTLDGGSLGSPLWTVLGAPISWNPLPYLKPDGTQQIYRAARNNPYWLLANSGLAEQVDRILPVLNLTYTPLKWLSITERLGGDMYWSKLDYHENIGAVENPTGEVFAQNISYQQFNNDLILNAHKDWNPDWSTDIVLGNNILSNYNDYRYTQGLGLSIPDFYNIGNASTVTSNYSYYRKRKIGFYGQANVEYKKILTLSLTGRYDGSSVLSQDKQFYPYGSASAGFIFSKALGLDNNSVLNFGKLRVSYSLVGNDAVGPYSLTNPYYQAGVGNIVFPYNGQNGFLLTTTYGYPLKNETVKEFEVGIEAKFLKDRISLDADYFNKKSTNLLTGGVPIAPGTGFNGATMNAGSMRNKGVEITLGGTPIKTKDFLWTVTLNFSKIDNSVLALAPGVDYLQFAGYTNPGIFAFAGQPYGVIYGSHLLRNDKGQLLLDDLGTPQIDPVFGPIGNVNPKWLAGFSSDFSYKGFSFSFILDMKHGGQMMNFDDYYLDIYGVTKATENREGSTIFPGIIQSTGAANTLAVKTNQAFWQNLWANVNETAVEDASYLKLRQVSLGYTFKTPREKIGFFKTITVTLSGTNFILYKNYSGGDPEMSLNGSGNGQGFANFMAPASKNYFIGVKASF
ncbi:MAG: SusC/RagA family TonB-linked outer membrane protein [Chitinophagaceae bacterium]|jgi:TonB-linked SusC/RagA family outer membrane protein|nr:SusC/RagA family TonB-linked outer membrane protein [Chitinophagaceae bacterium]